MAVIVTPKFNRDDIKAMILQKKQRIIDAILFNMKRIGEQFVRNCRQTNTYKDRTANLRSSIGYVILYNGNQIESNFQKTRRPSSRAKGSTKDKKGDGTEGMETAKKVMEELKKKYPTGFVLIGVAGMNYAAAVEAKSFDVITSSSQIASEALKTAITRIAKKVS